jgi:diguanylate cyclase (GGDEF)-like protein
MLLKTLERKVLAALFTRAAIRGEDIPCMRRHVQLTGLLNRNAFVESVRAKRSAGAVEGALAMLDLDFFRMVNDRHGHAAAGLVLWTMAQRVSTVLPQDVIVSRFAGDEFCLFIPGAMEEARVLADTLVTEARRPIALDEGVDVTSKPFAMAFLDIDHLGSYNKRHGDGRGDETLRQVSETIQRTARKNDMVFRKGGEEIVVLLPDATEAEARAAAERMRDAVQALAIRHDGSATAEVVTVTVGIASTRSDERSTVQDLMDRAADAAMQAKLRSERNRVHVA